MGVGVGVGVEVELKVGDQTHQTMLVKRTSIFIQLSTRVNLHAKSIKKDLFT